VTLGDTKSGDEAAKVFINLIEQLSGKKREEEEEKEEEEEEKEEDDREKEEKEKRRKEGDCKVITCCTLFRVLAKYVDHVTLEEPADWLWKNFLKEDEKVAMAKDKDKEKGKEGGGKEGGGKIEGDSSGRLPLEEAMRYLLHSIGFPDSRRMPEGGQEKEEEVEEVEEEKEWEWRKKRDDIFRFIREEEGEDYDLDSWKFKRCTPKEEVEEEDVEKEEKEKEKEKEKEEEEEDWLTEVGPAPETRKQRDEEEKKEEEGATKEGNGGREEKRQEEIQETKGEEKEEMGVTQEAEGECGMEEYQTEQRKEPKGETKEKDDDKKGDPGNDVGRGYRKEEPNEEEEGTGKDGNTEDRGKETSEDSWDSWEDYFGDSESSSEEWNPCAIGRFNFSMKKQTPTWDWYKIYWEVDSEFNDNSLFYFDQQGSIFRWMQDMDKKIASGVWEGRKLKFAKSIQKEAVCFFCSTLQPPSNHPPATLQPPLQPPSSHPPATSSLPPATLQPPPLQFSFSETSNFICKSRYSQDWRGKFYLIYARGFRRHSREDPCGGFRKIIGRQKKFPGSTQKP
jgi:hypothetical protein